MGRDKKSSKCSWTLLSGSKFFMGKFLEDKYSFRKFPVTIWYALLKSFRYGVLFVPAWVA